VSLRLNWRIALSYAALTELAINYLITTRFNLKLNEKALTSVKVNAKEGISIMGINEIRYLSLAV
jgi:hypothetical protein